MTASGQIFQFIYRYPFSLYPGIKLYLPPADFQENPVTRTTMIAALVLAVLATGALAQSRAAISDDTVSAITSGDTTIFRDSSGRNIGSATRNENAITFRDSKGRVTSVITNSTKSGCGPGAWNAGCTRNIGISEQAWPGYWQRD